MTERTTTEASSSDGATSALDDGLGLWLPCNDPGYSTNARPWVLERRNRKFWGGTETLQTASFNKRRFSTQAAAQKVADELNAELRGAEPTLSAERPSQATGSTVG
jgi:hypothetical protein